MNCGENYSLPVFRTSATQVCSSIVFPQYHTDKSNDYPVVQYIQFHIRANHHMILSEKIIPQALDWQCPSAEIMSSCAVCKVKLCFFNIQCWFSHNNMFRIRRTCVLFLLNIFVILCAKIFIWEHIGVVTMWGINLFFS